MFVSILIFLAIFSVIVISHEFGHFAVARRNGICVREFDIGMGPLLYRKKGKETDFCIRLLPIGGACIFDGADPVLPGNGSEKAEEAGAPGKHSFSDAPVGARIAAVLAGPMANILLGFILSCVVVAFSGADLPVVQEVIEGSAAMEAGIEKGDVIRKINGESIHINREAVIISMMNYGEPLLVTVERDGEKKTMTVIPRYDKEDSMYYIGLKGSGKSIRCSPLQVFQYGFYDTLCWLKLTYKSIGLIFRGHFTKDDIAGPVGIVKDIDDTYKETAPYGPGVVILAFLTLTSLLAVNLGVVNLLPIPALDGGTLIFFFLEAIKGRPIPPEKEGMIHLAGFIALMMLMLFVLFNDIARFFI